MAGNITLHMAAGNNMVMAAGRTLTLEGAGVVNAPASKIQVDNAATAVVMRRPAFNSLIFNAGYVQRLVVDNAGGVNITNSLTVGPGGLDFPTAGNLNIPAATTLTLQGAGGTHVTGAGAGLVNATVAGAVVQLTGNPLIDGAKFVQPIQTLRTGATPPAAPSLNTGTFSVNTLDHANGSLVLTVPMTINTGGTIAAGTPARVLDVASFGRLVLPNTIVLNNNGTLNVQSAGTLEIQGTGNIGGPNPVVYANTGARGTLLYSGGLNSSTTGLSFPNTMPGNVVVNRPGGSVSLFGASRTVQGLFSMQNGVFDMGTAALNLTLSGSYARTAGVFRSTTQMPSLTVNCDASSGIFFQATPNNQLNTLTGGATTVRMGSNVVVNNVQVPAGTLDVFTTTMNITGPTTSSIGATLNVPNMGRLVVENGVMLTNTGSLTVGGGGTLEIQNNPTLMGTPPNYTAANSVLLYSGAMTKITAAEFPTPMVGSVVVNKTGGTVQLNGSRTVQGSFLLQNGVFDLTAAMQTLTLSGPITFNPTASIAAPVGNQSLVVDGTGAIMGDMILSGVQRMDAGITMNRAGQTLRMGSFVQGRFSVQNGTFDTGAFLVRLSVGTLASGIGANGTLNVANGGRFVFGWDGSALFPNNGILRVQPGGTLGIEDNAGGITAGNSPDYVGVGSVLHYFNAGGAAAKLSTGLEFPNAMNGSVVVANTVGVGVQQEASTTKTVAGNFTFAGAAVYTPANTAPNGLVINGTLTNSVAGNFSSSGEALTFNGPVVNLIRWGVANTPGTLSFGAGSGNVQIATNVNVVNTLTMNGGLVDMGASTLTMTSAAGTIGGGGFSATRHIVGNLARVVNAAGTYNFPVGKGGAYLPFTLTNPGATLTTTVEAFNAAAGGSAGTGINTPLGGEHWRVNTSAALAGTPSVTLGRAANFAANTAVGQSATNVATSAYDNVGPAGFAGGMNTITSTAITPYSGTRFFTTGVGFFPEPTASATALSFSGITTTNFAASFTGAMPAATSYLVVRRPIASAPTAPVDGTVYTVNTAALGGLIIADIAHAGGVINIPTTYTMGLAVGSQWAIDIYSYNGTGASTNYRPVPTTGFVYLNAPANCLDVPTTVDVNLLERTIRFTGVSITGGGVITGLGTNAVFANPSGALNIAYSYAGIGAMPTYCPGCITQLYIGMNAGGTNVFRDCFSGNPFNTTGVRNINFTAPAAPGVYYVNVTATWDFVCQPVGFAETFVPNNTIAMVVVGTPPCLNNSDLLTPETVPAVPFTYNMAIPYAGFTVGAVPPAAPNVWRIRVRDGGTAAPDPDGFPTIVTQLTLTLNDPRGVVRRVALYDATGVTNLGEVAAAPVMNFTGLNIVAPDNGTVEILVKAAYNATPATPPMEGATFSLGTMNVVAGGGSSGFVNPGAIINSGNSGVNVVADRLTFSNAVTAGGVQPTNVGTHPLWMTPFPVVAAVDVNNNRDADYIGTVTVNSPQQFAPRMVAAVGGLATFGGASTLSFNPPAAVGQVLTASAAGLTNGASGAFDILAPTLNPTPAGPINFGNVAVGNFSEQSFMLAGANLNANGTVVTPVVADVTISIAGGGGFVAVPNIALNPTPPPLNAPLGSTVSQPVFLRFSPVVAGPIAGTVTGSVGAASFSVAFTGTGVSTVITPSATNFDFRNVPLGSFRDTTYTIQATNITGPLIIANSGTNATLISTGGGMFAPSLTLNPVMGTIPPTVITVRYTPNYLQNTGIGQITHTNAFTMPVNIPYVGNSISPNPISLAFSQVSSTGTQDVSRAVASGAPFMANLSSYRADGVRAAVPSASNIQYQVGALVGGAARFVIGNSTATINTGQNFAAGFPTINWVNAPIMGGTTTATFTAATVSGFALLSTTLTITISSTSTLPRITSLAPSYQGNDGEVVITGNNFAGTQEVRFGGVRAKSFSVLSATQISAILGSTGATGSVVVRTVGGQDSLVTAMPPDGVPFEFAPPPQITRFVPVEQGSGNPVTIFGRFFRPRQNLNAPNPVSVSFGGIPALSVTAISDTSLSATVGTGASGAVRVTTSGGSTTATMSFTHVPPPTITAISPLFGTRGTELVITGANFRLINPFDGVKIDSMNVQAFRVVSPSEIRAIVGDRTSGPLIIRNIAGSTTSTLPFTWLDPPVLDSVVPRFVAAGSRLSLHGREFVQVSAVQISGVTLASMNFQVLSTTNIVVAGVPNLGDATQATVRVRTPGGVTQTVTVAYVQPATLESFAPQQAGAGAIVTIRGTNFIGSVSVALAGVPADTVIVDSPTQLRVRVPRFAGFGPVVVRTVAGAVQSAQPFEFVPEPRINTISPAAGSTGSTVTIEGAGFANIRSVSFGGVTVAQIRIENVARMTVVLSTGASGRVQIVTDQGTATAATLFNFLSLLPGPPIITSVFPPSGSPGQVITINGLNFARTTQVLFANVPAARFTIESPTRLAAIVPDNTTTGTIIVQTPFGADTSDVEFRFFPPVIVRPLTQLDRDSAALMRFYRIVGDSVRPPRNWFTEIPLEDWDGVTIDTMGRERRIVGLRVGERRLFGVLPNTITDMSGLRSIDFSGNRLEGALPASIATLTNLQELRLNGNRLTSLPSEIVRLANLRVLRLDSNQFAGTFPAMLCQMPRLRELSLRGNMLTGVLPSCLGSMMDLVALDLSDNTFTGDIPRELGNLVNLERLVLARNRLEGAIPRTFGARTLPLLTKASPDGASAALNNLQVLDVSGNMLSDAIPAELWTLGSLRELSLAGNPLYGTLPATTTAQQLRVLDVSRTGLRGRLPDSLLLALRSLRVLRVDNNQLSGTVPNTIRLLTDLQELGLAGNGFTSVPELSGLRNLSLLRLENNALTFESIVPQMFSGRTVTFIPQDSVGRAVDTVVVQGQTLRYSVGVGGSANRYRWLKRAANGSFQPVQGLLPTSPELVLTTISMADSGTYICEITNAIAQGLTLVSRPLTVRVAPPGPPRGRAVLLLPANNASNVQSTTLMRWSRVENAVQYEVQISSERDFTTALRIITTATVRDTTWRVANLASLTQHHWRVRGVNPSGIGEWSAVSSFTTLPQGAVLAVSTINFGRVVVNERLRTTATITSFSATPIALQRVELQEGTQPAAAETASFRVLNFGSSTNATIRLREGESVTVDVEFAPKTLGGKSAAVVMSYVPQNGSQVQTVAQQAALRGMAGALDAVSSDTLTLIQPGDFQTVLIGNAAVSNVFITNKSSRAARILNVQAQDAAANTQRVFSTAPFRAERLLAVGDTMDVTAFCRPQTEGSTEGTLRIVSDIDTLNVPLTAFARRELPTDIKMQIRARVTPTNPLPGESVMVELLLDSTRIGDVFRAVPRPTFTVTTSFDRNVLTLDQQERRVFERGSRVERTMQVVVPATTRWEGRDNLLARFQCVSLSGDVDSTTVTVSGFEWGRPSASEVFVTGYTHAPVRVNVCQASGKRLTRVSRVTMLSTSRPNPASDAATMNYAVREEGLVTITLVDVMGKTVQTLVSGVHEPGEYELLASVRDVPSGMYSVVLTTPTERRVTTLHVLK
jgi:Leucine-rich repeat (LRR) protein